MIQLSWAASHGRKRRTVWGNELLAGANWCACTKTDGAVLISHQHKRASAPKPIRHVLLWLTTKCVSGLFKMCWCYLLDSREKSPSRLKCSLLQSGWENRYAPGDHLSPGLLLTKCFTWFSKAVKNPNHWSLVQCSVWILCHLVFKKIAHHTYVSFSPFHTILLNTWLTPPWTFFTSLWLDEHPQWKKSSFGVFSS